MYPTSTAYDNLVFSRDFARQFTPEVIMKLIDPLGRPGVSYTCSAAPWSKPAQLKNDIHLSNTYYRTLEPGNFVLDGTAQLIPADNDTVGEIGWVSSAISDADGCFSSAPVLTSIYSQALTTVGKTIFFDNNSQSFPVNFSVQYYSDNMLLETKVVVGNTNKNFYSFELTVEGYNKTTLTITKMSQPYSRVRIIEDVPGLYLRYVDTDVVSLDYSQRIDILAETIENSEIDVVVRNEDKTIDVLRQTGVGAFMKKRQAAVAYFHMVFPDAATEAIPLGEFYLSSWNTNREALTATFILQDALSKLTGMFNKGQYYPSQISLYDLAVQVLTSAGISNYTLDPVLNTLFTRGILPICTHKEALRYIAQAGCCVVAPTYTGGIALKYVGTFEQWPDPVDIFDYSILLNQITVEATPIIKSVSAEIFTHTVGSTQEKLYEGTRTINGTETFSVEFTSMGISASTAISAGTLVSAVYYAKTAILSITTVSQQDVVITITGNILTENKTKKTVSNSVEDEEIEDADEVEISNPLISSTNIADWVLAYVNFWKRRAHVFDIRWRGDPAIECLDPILVTYDIDENGEDIYTPVILSERSITYHDGVLGASSKGKY